VARARAAAIKNDNSRHRGDKKNYMGTNGATYRIGRGNEGALAVASCLPAPSSDERGPYLPVIIEACQEKYLSYEYRDGATSYGAFTFSMVKNLRQKPETTSSS